MEHVRPQVPALVVGVHDIAGVIDQQKIAILVPSHHRLDCWMVPIHDFGKHGLYKSRSNLRFERGIDRDFGREVVLLFG